jgi:STE24 endopeptidase
MNWFGYIILIALSAEVLLNTIADIFNLKMLQSEVPEEFKGTYDADQYRKSQEYLRVNTQFGWWATAFNLMVVLVFWFSGGFSLLDEWVRAFGFSPIVNGMLYIGILIVLHTGLSQPFSIYATFVIEERFGFNKTTWRTYLLDLIKGLLLSILLGGPLLAGILAFFEFSGDNAWIYCWIVAVVYMLIMFFIAPTWIMPLFNKFDPLEEGELKSAILSYAADIQFPLKNVSVMDGSKRSAKSNAFFAGFGKNKRIVLFDTLIAQHTVPEIVAVVAHEMGHYKKKHIVQGLLIGIIQGGVMFYLLSFFISNRGLFDTFYMEHISVYAGLIFFGMLYAPVDFFVGLLTQMRARANEHEADRYAVNTTLKPNDMIHVLKKLSVDNLSNLLSHPFHVFLNDSHPPVLKRIEAIKEIELEG